jgi:methionyl-tRNA synthetase
MKNKKLITSALPYANGPLHFGHIAGAYLPGDCYARFQRLKGSDVLYICGSDEHGVAITLSAELAGRTPKEHVDHFHEILKNFFKQLNFSFDYYSRTTWPGHVETTQAFFRDLLENGYIEAKVTDQLYSPQDKRFLADRYVVGTCPRCGFVDARGDECQKCGASYEAPDLLNPRSKMTGAPLILKPTEHWFLRFDLLKDRLSEWIATKSWKANVLNFAKYYIDHLKPRAITRDSDWGIPVPLKEAEGKVFYVWFDAPIGYISATRDWAQSIGEPDAWKKYWLDPTTQLVHFIGKDNIPFHAVFFPAMCMGQNQPYQLVSELPANEFYNLEGKQFSKSEGWYIDLDRFFNHFTADQIRYVIASNAPETHDAEFTWRDFQLRCNSELLGKFGNLANRVLTFAQMHCEGKVPNVSLDQDFSALIINHMAEINSHYEHFRLRKAAAAVMELAQAGNVYFDATKPWALAKDPTKREDMHRVMASCIECLKALALAASPIIPDAAEKLWKMLGFSIRLSDQKWDDVLKNRIFPGLNLPKPEILFHRVEDEVIAAEMEKLKASAPKQVVVKNDLITIEDVRKVDLRVVKILSVERVPKSNKLLKFVVDLGTEQRVVVSGIGEKIENPSDLIGRKVLFVANLKPAKLMGIESQGMLLTAEGSQLELPHFKEVEVGSSVT